MNKNNLEDSSRLRLQWYSYEDRMFFTAGIGFYNGSYGDYSLKLNMGRGKLYLRPVSFEDGQTRFRVEEVKQENGRVTKEVVGFGLMDETTKGKIHIKIGGYSDLLILG